MLGASLMYFFFASWGYGISGLARMYSTYFLLLFVRFIQSV